MITLPSSLSPSLYVLRRGGGGGGDRPVTYVLANNFSDTWSTWQRSSSRKTTFVITSELLPVTRTVTNYATSRSVLQKTRSLGKRSSDVICTHSLFIWYWCEMMRYSRQDCVCFKHTWPDNIAICISVWLYPSSLWLYFRTWLTASDFVLPSILYRTRFIREP